MPTIEIVCLEQQEPFLFPDLSFALESENEAISHRGLFYEEFKGLKGCIYHLGNPQLRCDKHGGYFAQQLLNWPDDRLKFLPEFAVEVQQVFTKLLEESPIQALIFSSDYQFGPNARRYQRPLKHETFWRKHDAGKLRLNARYFIQS